MRYFLALSSKKKKSGIEQPAIDIERTKTIDWMNLQCNRTIRKKVFELN